ncbi:CHAT domain-containing protein [Cristinia sonorae]|uniref:CHAT domain-containing protein n=1 Tax=Cristinia sonorae TaxID=1940300 RepID=A0A8K0ULF8_9AGAR|nr:CHAT domain-containing protein [Cristinia sonorae]
MENHVTIGASLDPLEESTTLHQQALRLLPPESDEYTVTLANLSQVYLLHYRLSHNLDDLNTSITFADSVVKRRPTGHTRRAIALHHLSQSLILRVHATWSQEDALWAVTLNQEALELGATATEDPSINRQFQLSYATALCARGAVMDNEADINQAVETARGILDSPPIEGIDHIATLHGLSTALRFRFRLSGRPSDINEAIIQYRRILDVCDTRSPDLWIFTTNLADLLRIRAFSTNSLDDLSEATTLYQHAYGLCPAGHFLLSKTQTKYALAISQSLGDTPSVSLLNEAISLQRRAFDLADPSDESRWLQLKQIGDSYLALHSSSKPLDPSFLQQALSHYKLALELCPFPGSERAEVMCAMGSTLCTLILADIGHESSGTKLVEALALYARAADILPPGHPRHTSLISPFIARLFLTKYSVQKEDADFMVAAQAISEFMRCSSLSIPTRLKFATQWLATGIIRDNATTLEMCRRSVSDLFDQVMDLLPRVAYLAQDPQSRLEAIGLAPQLTHPAAAHAIAIGDYERAVEYVEHGRSIFWSHALRLRSPLDQLKDTSAIMYEKMAEKLRDLHAMNSLHMEGGYTRTTEAEQRSSTIQRLTDEFDELLEETRRTVPGAQDFLRPRRFKQLLDYLHGRTVVIVIPRDNYTEATILNPSSDKGPIQRLNLPGLSSTGARRIRLAMRRSCGEPVPRSRSEPSAERAGSDAGRGGSRMEDILERLWIAVVKPILAHTGLMTRSTETTTRETRPRLWWCPTGEAVFLPFHAAGKYKSKARERGECISDYVVSSYIPNLTFLSEALQRPLPSAEDMKLLLLSQPRAHRQRRLYYTGEELERIARLTNPSSLLTLSPSPASELALDVTGTHTTTENVLATIPHASVLHLACHGTVDLDDSLNSGFEMRDGRLTVLKLMQLDMPHAFFAFLSACQSASGSEELPDEALDLASTMLFVGFRSVIGTMWSMADIDGPEVAEVVYKELLRNNVLDPDAIPYALDNAVHNLRLRGVSAARWACYIHSGI